MTARGKSTLPLVHRYYLIQTPIPPTMHPHSMGEVASSHLTIPSPPALVTSRSHRIILIAAIVRHHCLRTHTRNGTLKALFVDAR